jgi:2-polyprenyl-3-methyl-5-hydroxy-6-metoxy-1,4-benzoquinol methylase
MGKEKGAEAYTGAGYLKKGVFESSLKLYEEATDFLPTPSECPTIVDLGCGVGYFAKVLFDSGYKDYIGIDFSDDMVRLSTTLGLPYEFVKGNITSSSFLEYYIKYNVFTCLEVLEHIENDTGVLNNLPSGALIVLSVPNRDFHSHVRHFNSIDEVIDRYSPYINFTDSKTIITNENKKAKVFICRGVIKYV